MVNKTNFALFLVKLRKFLQYFKKNKKKNLTQEKRIQSFYFPIFFYYNQ